MVTLSAENHRDDAERTKICLDCNQDYRSVSFHRASRYYSTGGGGANEYYFNNALSVDLEADESIDGVWDKGEGDANK